MFGILWVVSRKASRRLREGDLLLLYGVLYPIGRLLVEFQRPDAWRIAGVPTAQWVALVAMVGCGVALWLRHRGPAERVPAGEVGA